MKFTTKHLEDAIIFATEKHSGQTRKGDGRPYILHPIAVMQLLYKYKKSNNALLLGIAALLHDLVEDCDVTLEEIANRFGYGVTTLVQELTSDKDEINRLGKTEHLTRKMLAMSSYGLRIKLIDRLHNLEDIDQLDVDKKALKINETETILDALKKRHLTKTHKLIIKDIRKKMKVKS